MTTIFGNKIIYTYPNIKLESSLCCFEITPAVMKFVRTSAKQEMVPHNGELVKNKNVKSQNYLGICSPLKNVYIQYVKNSWADMAYQSTNLTAW